MFAADDKYSRHNRQKFPQPVQMQLPKKIKPFFAIFYSIFGIYIKFEHFEKKKKTYVFLKLLTLKDVVTKKQNKFCFRKPFRSQSVNRC